MPRTRRRAPGGVVFHVLNRGVGRMRLFEAGQDFAAFEQVLNETLPPSRMRLLAYCLMPNHWHLVLWPREDGDLAAFMQRLSITHVRRWQEHRQLVGTGHVYQGRYKSFPVQTDAHFLAVCRYLERNPLRAGLVNRAENWRWSSLWRRMQRDPESRGWLSDWLVEPPRDWASRVNAAETDEELARMRACISRGLPLGSAAWARRTIARLGLESSLRPRGRPPKAARRGQ